MLFLLAVDESGVDSLQEAERRKRKAELLDLDY